MAGNLANHCHIKQFLVNYVSRHLGWCSYHSVSLSIKYLKIGLSTVTLHVELKLDVAAISVWRDRENDF